MFICVNTTCRNKLLGHATFRGFMYKNSSFILGKVHKHTGDVFSFLSMLKA